ncbi:MAG TPA: hypothetical protein VMY16_07875 [Ilumatobacteraceae bacterium]|nr:hypothetical protein [Ilumatobacteraceae bacterium]
MKVTEQIEVLDGVEMYRISPIDQIDPFLMSVVSSSDLWMFLSSTGGLTAGRVEAQQCIFPYETDDRLHHVGGRVGPVTVLRIGARGATTLWEPFTGDAPDTRRSLLKSLLGNVVVFEEQHLGLGLTMRYRWAPSDRFGWVRTASLTHHEGDEPVTVEILDGLLDVMPWGIGVPFQQQMSNLANAYRRSEITESGVGVFTLEALIVDVPEPSEALRATTVWSTGLDEQSTTLDPRAVAAARDGQPFAASSLRTGRPGSFLVNATVRIDPGQSRRWHVVADVAQTHADIARLTHGLATTDDLSRELDDDVARCTAALRDIVASADGMQLTASSKVDAHHLANTLFNVMRGGTFADGYTVESERFRDFLTERNSDLASKHANWLGGLPDSIDVADLQGRAAQQGDPNLMRLSREYLPLSFSRRHGDPSRPWNQFAIRVRDAEGDPLLSYQGNWRDIFQNWEALCQSFPGFLPSIVAKFVNASTADGFNPYRITSDGIDWEVPEPENPWSGIGYWGDHQIVYLYRLLSTLRGHDPAWLGDKLGERAYAYANVPYRIAPFEQVMRNPKDTIEFDSAAATAIAERVDRLGADGRLVLDANGAVLHVSLLEKLLIPALAKISNYVPRGGIWMNTQRHEWNDANNALVGYGLSMVTLAHLRRYLQVIEELTGDLADDVPISPDVVAWIERLISVFESHEQLIGAPSIDDGDRFQLIRGLGMAFDHYRSRLDAAGPTAPTPIAPATLRRLLRTSMLHLDDSLRAARRPDGLYDAYNLVAFSEVAGRPQASTSRLQPMLEGQVAAISSGLLDVGQIVALVDAMYDSDLYRADVDSFVLYPARRRPAFLERNRVPADAVESNELLAALLAGDNDDIVVRDVDGKVHFNADFTNAADLSAALDALAASDFGPLVADHADEVLEVYERVFNHHEFTGRSSTMYAFEGIGSVYWHMVAKLLVALQEAIVEAPAGTADDSIGDLVRRYDRVRGGLGFNRTAVEYGAFPTDPYSHTPAHAGAQQPGMTGQVKEELLTRWAELGLVVSEGSIHFSAVLFSEAELRTEAGTLVHLDAAGRLGHLDVPPGAAAFTICRVPVVVSAADTPPMILITLADGSRREVSGSTLDRETSRQVFDQTATIARIDVTLSRRSIRR